MGRGIFLRQIILNIIMTVSFGFLLPLIKKGKIIKNSVIYNFTKFNYRNTATCDGGD